MTNLRAGCSRFVMPSALCSWRMAGTPRRKTSTVPICTGTPTTPGRCWGSNSRCRSRARKARPRLWPKKSGKPGRGRTFPRWPAATATLKPASRRTPTVAAQLRVAEFRAEALLSIGYDLKKPGSASVYAAHGRTVEPRRCDVHGIGDRLIRGSEQRDAPARIGRSVSIAGSHDFSRQCEPDWHPHPHRRSSRKRSRRPLTPMLRQVSRLRKGTRNHSTATLALILRREPL